MKFALLGVVAFAQFGRQGQQYGREDGQQLQRQQPHRDNMFGRFGGKTDVNMRDNRYGYNKHVGRYGGYTRRYNPTTHRFMGREDPFRQDANGDGYRGYHLYGRGQERRRGKNGQKQKNSGNRLGEICSQITSQNYERECGTYTGRMGCRYTCEKLREGRKGYTNFGRKTKKTNPFARYMPGKTQQRQYPQMQQPRFGGRTQTNPMQRFGQKTYGQRIPKIPTQGGIFGRRKTGSKTTKTNPFSRIRKAMKTRGLGQNGIFGNRLGQEGNNRRIQV